MRQLILACAALCALTLVPSDSQAMLSKEAADLTHQFQTSDAVVRGVITGRRALKSAKQGIETQYTISAQEVLKGRLPNVIHFYVAGGTLDGECVREGCQPNLVEGQERIFFLTASANRHLKLNGDIAGTIPPQSVNSAIPRLRQLAVTSFGAIQDFTDASESVDGPIVFSESDSTGTTNLFTDDDYGFPARYISPDRGQPIFYWVDADALPGGMTTNTAMAALQNALNAWTSVAFLKFQFAGFASFGTSAADVTTSEGALRIQFHDLYGRIGSPTTLGIGGQGMTYSVLTNGSTYWTTGGRVYSNDFQTASRGYVVLNHTNSSMQNPVTFEEVLCHEIGHALGMMHSSEDINEPTASPAYQAIMYYLVHADGRGAAPTLWDIDVLQQAYPLNNPPPYSFDRMMDIITAVNPPDLPGVNEIQLKGDILSSSITSEVCLATLTNNGLFTLANNVLRYTPAANWSTSARIDPASGGYRGSIYYRISDGTHASPWGLVRVLSWNQDQYPAGAIDGIPDNWMILNFGSANPSAGPNRGAIDDYDGDGLTNRDEYRAWMDPKASDSAQHVFADSDGTISWQGQAYEVYELWSSTNLVDWAFDQAVLATNNSPSIKVPLDGSDLKAFRIVKVP